MMNKALFLLCMVGVGLGCTKVKDPSLKSAPNQIALRSGVLGTVVNKAPVVPGTSFTAQVCGWEAETSAVAWTVAPKWTSTSNVTASTVASEMLLNPVRTYSEGEPLTTTLCAWSPVGTLTAGKVVFDNPTGELDVMLTWPVSGTNDAQINELLLFEHTTTQLRFVVVGTDWFAGEYIESITVQSVRVPLGIDLATRALIGSATGFISLPGIPAGGVIPGSTPSELGRPLMLVPVGSNKLFLDVKTPNRYYTGVEVTTTDVAFVAGRSYTVTLTFTGAKEIVVGSTVGEWTQGTAGGEVVD